MRPGERVRTRPGGLARIARRGLARVAWPILLASPLVLAACRIEAGGSEQASASPHPRVMPTGAADTILARCPEGLPALAAVGRIPTGVEAARLLPVGDGLLLVGKAGGLFRHAGGRTERLLDGGKDYALSAERLVRLGDGRIDVFAYRPGGPLAREADFPVPKHDVSVALLGGALFVHSAFNGSALILRRSMGSGSVESALLPVERDLVRGLLLGAERLHEDEGVLRGSGSWLLYVPGVRDPVHALDLSGSRHLVLELAEGRRGRVRAERRTVRDSRACPACTRHVEVRARVRVVPLYADAAVGPGVAWILRLDPPGSAGSVLLRVALDALEVRAWRLGFPATPGALVVWRDSLAIAAGADLWRFPIPPTATGARCASGAVTDRSGS